MNKHDWAKAFESLPPGLSRLEVSRRLGLPYPSTRAAIKRFAYATYDGRRYSQQATRKLIPEKADWTWPNVRLAAKFGVSRERVRVVRAEHGQPKVKGRARKLAKGFSDQKLKTTIKKT